MDDLQKKHDLLARVAWMYYHEGMTQQEIADEIGVSRFKIMNMLNEARNKGLIKVQFISPIFNCLSVEKELKEKFKLSDAVVAPTPRNPANLKKSIGIAGSDYLEKVLEDGDKLGSALGTTVFEVAKYFTPREKKDVDVVLVVGGLTTESVRMSPYDSAKMIADKLNSPCYYIFAPAIVDSKEIREAIFSDKKIQKAMEMALSVNKVLIGIGDVGEESFIYRNEFISKETLSDLRKRGAVGDVLGRFFDINGKLIPSDIQERVISLDIEKMKEIDTVIAVAGGERKVEAIYGALRAAFIDVLVTDESTARSLIDFKV